MQQVNNCRTPRWIEPCSLPSSLEAAREKLDEEILNIRRTLWQEPAPAAGGRDPSTKARRGGPNEAAPKKRGLTPAGRKRLSQLMKPDGQK
jgi:hypothetical protein